MRETMRNVAMAMGMALLLMNAGQARAANVITNGTFEAHPNSDASSTTFTGWSESPGTTAVVAPTALSGSASAHMIGTAPGSLNQTLPFKTTAPFEYSLTFAALSPAGDNGGTRTLNLFLQASTGGSQVNLRVIRPDTTQVNGNVQVYNGTGWSTILNDVVQFSGDLSSPVTNTLSITGVFAGAGSSSYQVTVNSNASSVVSHFQNNAPADLGRISFSTVNPTTVDYVIDDVVATPEPGVIGLSAVGAVLMLSRRRRPLR